MKYNNARVDFFFALKPRLFSKETKAFHLHLKSDSNFAKEKHEDLLKETCPVLLSWLQRDSGF